MSDKRGNYAILIYMGEFGQTRSVGTIFDTELFRRDVRRDVRNCALFLFFFYAVYLIASIIVMALVMLFGDAFQNLMTDPEALLNIVSDGGLSGAGGQDLTDTVTDMMERATGPMSIAGIVAGGCVFFILRKRRFITDIAAPAFEQLTPKICVILVLVTQAIQYVYGLIVSLIDELLPEGISLLDSYGSVMEGLFTPIGILYIVLIGPVFEELIFRGAVMGSLRRFGDNFAILFSALFFGFYHAIVLQIPFGFLMGLLFGYAAGRWSLRVSIALHIIVNGLSMLFSISGSEDFTNAVSIIMLACTALTVIFAIKWRKILRLRFRAGSAYYPGTYRNGFSSIAFWVFIVVMSGFGLFQMTAM